MKRTKRALQLGIFVATAIILFVIAIYMIGSKGNLFSSNTDIYASFKDIRGLVSGNIVRFAGINVGTVKDIRIVADSSVIVTMSVRDKYTQYIYKNSAVQIGQEGLMGGKIVIISTGDPETGKVEEGDYLPIADGLDIQAIIAQATHMLDEATGTVANLRSVTDKIDSGRGDFARFINEDNLTVSLRSASNRLNATLEDVHQITRKVNSGQGDIGKLINDDQLTTEINNIMANLNATTQRADSLVNQLHITSRSLNEGEGVLPRLLHDKQMGLNVDTAIASVDQGVVQITRAAETIADSWIFRLFSGRKKKKETAPATTQQPVQEFNVKAGDTIVIPSNENEIPELRERK